MRGKQRTANFVLAIVGLRAKNSTFVILLGICANVKLTFFKFLTIVNTKTVGCYSVTVKYNICVLINRIFRVKRLTAYFC
jgi:hypothetical protein